MHNDKLEKFVTEHQQEFNNEMPSGSLWDKIDRDLPVAATKNRKTLFYVRYAAASVILLIATATITRYWVSNSIPRFGASSFTASMKNEIKSPLIIHTQPEKIMIQVKEKNTHIADNQAKPARRNDPSPNLNGFDEINMYYTAQIISRKNEIFRLTSGSSVNQQIDLEVGQLDSIYISLKKDLKDNMNNPEVVEAFILQYRVKLEMLDNILNQLQANDNNDKTIKYEI